MQKLIRTLAVLLTFGIATTPLVACKKREDKAQEEAAKAKKEADEKAAQAERERKEADAKAAAAAAEAEKKAAEANAEVVKNLQKDVDAADRKITDLKEREAKATGATKKNAEAAAAEVDKRREAVKTSLTALQNATGAAWAGARTQAESDLAALNKAIDNFDDTLKAKK